MFLLCPNLNTETWSQIGLQNVGCYKGFGGGGGKEGFWCPWRRTLARFIGKIEELDKIREELDIGGAMDKSYTRQKDFVTQSGGVSKNIHQLCVIITKAAEENHHADNAAIDVQVNKSRSNNKKEKGKIHVSTGEWRIIMSTINHSTEVSANSRREVLMGYQYALHQHKCRGFVNRSAIEVGVWRFVEGGEHGRAIQDGGSTSLPSFRSGDGGEILRAAIIHYMATSARLQ
jgi:hypothetical protein